MTLIFAASVKNQTIDLEVSRNLCNFAFDGSNDRAPAFGLTRTTIFLRGCYARCTCQNEGRAPAFYESRLTPLFYQKTLKHARKSDIDYIGVCGNRTLSLKI